MTQNFTSAGSVAYDKYQQDTTRVYKNIIHKHKIHNPQIINSN